MAPAKKVHPKIKAKLHPRSKHRERYDFKQLTASCPELTPFVQINKYDDESIDYFDPEAVRMLNTALLKHFYRIENWSIPSDYLCPTIPGRADYIHHMADVLSSSNQGKIPMGPTIKCLDIGVGANCIYPVIGTNEYGWSFIGSDIDPISLRSAERMVELNPFLKEMVELRLQQNSRTIFNGIIQRDELIDLSICNPPFHASFEEAQAGTLRKLRNLKRKKISKPLANLGGRNSELWCDGGEHRFVQDIIYQSKKFAFSCFWFSSLVSKQSNLKAFHATLKKVGVVQSQTVPMGQGNKSSRILAWTFLSPKQQELWANMRWTPEA